MPCNADAIQSYLSGKKYAKLQRLQCVENEEVKKHLVQSHKKGREHQLYCLLTQRHLNNRHDHIMKHVEGKRFQRALKRWEECQRTGEEYKPAGAKRKRQFSIDSYDNPDDKKEEENDVDDMSDLYPDKDFDETKETEDDAEERDSPYEFDMEDDDNTEGNDTVSTIDQNGSTNLGSVKRKRKQMAELHVGVDLEEEIPNESEIVCHVCWKVFKHQSSLNRHFIIHENPDISYECDLCGKTFQRDFLLQTHKKRQHESQDPHVCQYCGNVFSSRPSLSNHIRNAHLGKKLKCQVCDKSFKDNYALTRHMKSHDATTSACPICSKKVKELEAHIEKCGSWKPPNLFACETCGTTFATEANLKKHLKHRHNPTIYTCECGKPFPYKFSLKRHQKKCGNRQ